MDVVAGAVQRQAQPGDLVVVYPWYFGVSFGRYFQGDTAWVTLPEIEDVRFHRYDLLRAKILTEFPVRPVLARMEQTLRSGRRVWFVGEPPAGAARETAPPTVPPGPLPGVPNGWWEAYHTDVWGRQAAYFLNHHARQIESVPVASDRPVLEIEAVPLYVAQGWRQPDE